MVQRDLRECSNGRDVTYKARGERTHEMLGKRKARRRASALSVAAGVDSCRVGPRAERGRSESIIAPRSGARVAKKLTPILFPHVGSMEMDELGLRRYTRGVDEKEHVVPARGQRMRMPAVRRRGFERGIAGAHER